MADYPLEEILDAMERRVREGMTVWFKFNCAHCGARQTSSQANSYHVEGYSCEECGKITVPTEGNYMVAYSTNKSYGQANDAFKGD